MRASENAKKLRDCQAHIENLMIENEKWKAYRLSEEDEARRQTRKYKKRVQELELLLQKQTDDKTINELERFKQIIEGLKQEIILREKQSEIQLQA